jgi:hypothetical protein
MDAQKKTRGSGFARIQFQSRGLAMDRPELISPRVPKQRRLTMKVI